MSIVTSDHDNDDSVGKQTATAISNITLMA